MNTTQEQENEQAALAKQATAQQEKAAKAKAEAAKLEADRLIAEAKEQTQADLTDEVELIEIGKRAFDKAIVKKAVKDALSDAGRWRKLATDSGLMRKVNEADASQASIFAPSVIRDLIKSGKVNRQYGNRLLALNQLVASLEVLATPISDTK